MRLLPLAARHIKQVASWVVWSNEAARQASATQGPSSHLVVAMRPQRVCLIWGKFKFLISRVHCSSSVSETASGAPCPSPMTCRETMMLDSADLVSFRPLA